MRQIPVNKNATENAVRLLDYLFEMLDTAFEWAKTSDGILTFSYHWYSPRGGRDKSFYAANTDFNADRIGIGNN